MNISTIKHSVDVWTEVRQTSLALTLLTSGTGFSITQYEFEKWLSINAVHPIEEIYVYLAVMETEMAFWLVDSYSDAQAVAAIEGSHGQPIDLSLYYRICENTFLKWYTKSPELLSLHPEGGSIPHLDLGKDVALSRNLRWNLYSNLWFQQKQMMGTETIVQVFQLPFSDLETLFSLPDMLSVDVLFALKDYEPSGTCNQGETMVQDVELILSSRPSNEDIEKVFADVTCPCPPFCRGKKFGLLLTQASKY